MRLSNKDADKFDMTVMTSLSMIVVSYGTGAPT